MTNLEHDERVSTDYTRVRRMLIDGVTWQTPMSDNDLTVLNSLLTGYIYRQSKIAKAETALDIETVNYLVLNQIKYWLDKENRQPADKMQPALATLVDRYYRILAFHEDYQAPTLQIAIHIEPELDDYVFAITHTLARYDHTPLYLKDLIVTYNRAFTPEQVRQITTTFEYMSDHEWHIDNLVVQSQAIADMGNDVPATTDVVRQLRAYYQV